MNEEEILADFIGFLAAVAPKLYDIFKQHGRDAVLEALDATIVAMREKTDADLRNKPYEG